MMWVLFFMALIGIGDAAGPLHSLRAACRMGQPPFNDAISTKNTSRCEGMMATLFNQVAAETGIQVTWMGNLDQSNIDNFLIVDPKTNQSVYDVIITFHTVTPTRMIMYDFSVTVVASSDTVALRPSYLIPTGSLAQSVVRPAVLYIVSVMSFVIVAGAIVILICEHFFTELSPIHMLAPWKKYVWALEMSFEATFTWSTSEVVVHQISRSIRPMIAILSLFLISVLGALITADLTTSSSQFTTVNVADLAGTSGKIAIASSTLKSYFDSLNIATKQFDNINEFAEKFYSGDPIYKDYFGFCTSSEVVNYLHNKYNAPLLGFTLTAPFIPSGSVSLKAYPFSKLVPQATLNLFDYGLQQIRERGALSEFFNEFVQSPLPPIAQDIQVDHTLALSIYIIGSVFLGLLMLSPIGIKLYSKFYLKKHKKQQDGPNEKKKDNNVSSSTVPVADDTEDAAAISSSRVGGGGGGHLLRWKGRLYKVDPILNMETIVLLDYVAERVKGNMMPVPVHGN
eukprot:PhF_6_TR34185/c0_g1_i1/m.50051